MSNANTENIVHATKREIFNRIRRARTQVRPTKTIPLLQAPGVDFYLLNVVRIGEHCPHIIFLKRPINPEKGIWHAGSLLANRELEGLVNSWINMKSFGAIVIVLGIVMTTLTGFNIITKKKVADLGSVEITKEEKTPVYWSPITGGVLIVVGLVLVIAGKKKI